MLATVEEEKDLVGNTYLAVITVEKDRLVLNVQGSPDNRPHDIVWDFNLLSSLHVDDDMSDTKSI